ncbi:hypothetical protein K0M31_009927 [Melipona bicolor]|uniref:Uncharacterized protein n=1 Tax=Melipona bicolor TaxID=60889 RepID=A0AA40KIY6_9HYME|nr:hypothetical protein K0M31_009927 [Melipona bicolor]
MELTCLTLPLGLNMSPSRSRDQEEDNEDNSIKRPTRLEQGSFSKYTWLPEDEESTKLEGPRPVLPPAPPPPTSQAPKTKHVSFARSHTLTSFDVPRSRSPPRPQNQERLIDSQPTIQNAMLPSTLPMMHPYTANEPRVIVLGESLFSSKYGN